MTCSCEVVRIRTVRNAGNPASVLIRYRTLNKCSSSKVERFQAWLEPPKAVVKFIEQQTTQSPSLSRFHLRASHYASPKGYQFAAGRRTRPLTTRSARDIPSGPRTRIQPALATAGIGSHDSTCRLPVPSKINIIPKPGPRSRVTTSKPGAKTVSQGHALARHCGRHQASMAYHAQNQFQANHAGESLRGAGSRRRVGGPALLRTKKHGLCRR